MHGIRQHGEKVLVTPGTAAVLGRAVPFSGKTGGVATCLERPPGSLNQDRVFPVVAEVIGMAAVPAHRRLDRLMQVAQRHLTGNEGVARPVASYRTASP